MGMSISTSEEIKFNPTTGQILTDNTWVGLYNFHFGPLRSVEIF